MTSAYTTKIIPEVPAHLAHPRFEPNLLWYGPSTLIGAYNAELQLVGVIRIALRIKTPLAHGMMTDLHIDAQNLNEQTTQEIAKTLIAAAESFLREKGVAKIDSIVLDGAKLAQPFIDNGYWASRKSVVVEWDLATTKEPAQMEGVELTLTPTITPEECAQFIISSYQPYWRWWKNDAFDRLWERIDYPDYAPDEVEKENSEHNHDQILTMLEDANGEGMTGRHIFAVARKEGKIIGFCDAKIVEDLTDDCSDWGVLILREHPGKGFGQLLLLSCLQWLKRNGQQKAVITTTSGLDDFDPTVYLYVQSCGGKIKGEFNNLVKRKF